MKSISKKKKSSAKSVAKEAPPKKKIAGKKPVGKGSSKKKASAKKVYILKVETGQFRVTPQKVRLTASDIYSPKNASNIAVYQVVETIRRLRKINTDISKISIKTARKYAAKKK